MGFWDKQDKRYTQARHALIFSIIAVSLSILVVAALTVFTLRKESESETGEFKMSSDRVEIPMPTPSAEDLRRAKLAAWHERLEELTKDLRWPEAETLALEILEEETSDSLAWVALARAQQNSGRENEALDALSKALSDREVAPYALYLRSGLLRQRGNFDAAIADLEQASELDPGGVAISNTLMLAKIQAGRDEEVRHTILAYIQAGIPSQEPRWTLPAAAMALKDEKPALAAKFFEVFERIAPASLSDELLADPIFDPYRQQDPWKILFERSRRKNSAASVHQGGSPAAGQ